MKPLDLTGQRFGRGTVTAFAGSHVRAGRRARLWHLRCDCGNEYEAETTNLRNGDVRSCGCLAKETFAQNAKLYAIPANTKAPGVAAFNCLIAVYKNNARTRGLEWKLSEDEVRGLVFANCYYCGQEPSRLQRRNQTRGRTSGTAILVGGIDRLNPLLGYTPENCVPCCFPCNSAKSTLSEEEFLALVARIYKHSLVGEVG